MSFRVGRDRASGRLLSITVVIVFVVLDLRFRFGFYIFWYCFKEILRVLHQAVHTCLYASKCRGTGGSFDTLRFSPDCNTFANVNLLVDIEKACLMYYIPSYEKLRFLD